MCQGGFGEEDLLAVDFGGSARGVCVASVGRVAGLEGCATSRGEVADVDEHAASIAASTTTMKEGVDRRARGSLLQDEGYAVTPTRVRQVAAELPEGAVTRPDRT